jgi:hypothetical protein
MFLHIVQNAIEKRTPNDANNEMRVSSNPMSRAFNKFNQQASELDKEENKDYYNEFEIKMTDIHPPPREFSRKENEVRIELDHFSDSPPSEPIRDSKIEENKMHFLEPYPKDKNASFQDKLNTGSQSGRLDR